MDETQERRIDLCFDRFIKSLESEGVVGGAVFLQYVTEKEGGTVCCAKMKTLQLLQHRKSLLQAILRFVRKIEK